MSKESLDYEKLCCNYYSSWEDGCCMESCEHYHRDECPIIYVKELLAKKDDKISTIEKQLATMEKAMENAIIPKFKIGQEVYVVSSGDVYKITIDSITIEKEETYIDFIYYDVWGNGYDWVFATKEEALAKLKELKNGSICD